MTSSHSTARPLSLSFHTDKHPEAFTDIVKGTDKISRYGGTFPYGFDCRKGWDPVTGFGTPAFAKLLAAVTE